MTDSIRESIIGAIVTAVGDIRTANGYNSDAGRLVKRGQAITDQDQLPALSVVPGVELNEPIAGRNVLTMRMRVNGVIKYSSKNPSVVAEALLADIIKRMTNPSLASAGGGYTEKIEYAGGGVEEYPESGQYSVAVFAEFAVKYKTNLGDPFNQ